MWKRPLHIPDYYADKCGEKLEKIQYINDVPRPPAIDLSYVNLILLAINGERGLPTNLTRDEMRDCVIEAIEWYIRDPDLVKERVLNSKIKFHIDARTHQTKEQSLMQLRSATTCYMFLQDTFRKRDITSEALIEAHKYMTFNSNMPHGIRHVNVFAGNTVFLNHAQVAPFLERWCYQVYTYLHEDDGQNPIEATSYLIESFLMIHPFRDGNGRFARWLLSLLIMSKGFPYPFCIHQKKWIASLKFAHGGGYSKYSRLNTVAHGEGYDKYSRLNALIIDSMLEIKGYCNEKM